MTDQVVNPFAFITRLPEAGITQPMEKHDGVFIQGAFVEGPGRQVVIETVFGPNVPTPVYTLNVGGRGSLVLGEQEFRDIVSAGLAMFEMRQTPRSEPTTRSAAGSD